MSGWKMAGWLSFLCFLMMCPGWGTAQETAPPTEEEAAVEEAAAPPPGDPRRGEALYVGSAPFAKGGAPCLACHGIAGHGLGGGASYGPDLSAVHQGFGTEGLLVMLEEIPFPSMEPIYAGRPLTPQERADLAAFLAEVSGQTPAVAGDFVLKGSLGAAIVLAAILAAGWRRLRGVRAALIEEARQDFGGKRP